MMVMSARTSQPNRSDPALLLVLLVHLGELLERRRQRRRRLLLHNINLHRRGCELLNAGRRLLGAPREVNADARADAAAEEEDAADDNAGDAARVELVCGLTAGSTSSDGGVVERRRHGQRRQG